MKTGQFRNNYTITIRNNTTGTKKNAVATPTSDSNTYNQIEKASGVIKGATIYATGKQLANTIITHNINTTTLRTGQVELQQRLNYAYNGAKSAFSVIESAFMGVAVTGNPLGAFLGVAVDLGWKAVEFSQKLDIYNLNKSVEQVNLENANLRAGFNGSRGINQ